MTVEIAGTTTRSRVVSTFVDLAAIESPAHEERECANYIIGYLEALGLDVSEDDAATTIPAGAGNLTVRLPGTTDGTPIFLCSHMDTVALADKVVPVITDDGRITNEREAILGGDNKAAVAVMLELVHDIVKGDIPHAGLEVVFTPCEEVGLLGAKAYDPSQLHAKLGFVYDHGNDIGKIVQQAPSQVSLRFTFIGRAAHSGIAPEEGRSAIRAAAEALSRMPHGKVDEQSTANVGLIEGGTAVNIVPEYCTLRAEARSLDHARATELANLMIECCTDTANAHGVDVEIDMVDEYRAYSFREANPAIKIASAALSAAGYTPELIPCGGGSDANIFNGVGLTCANLCNGMRMIHTSDEYMEIVDLEGMLRVSHELIANARNDS